MARNKNNGSNRNSNNANSQVREYGKGGQRGNSKSFRGDKSKSFLMHSDLHNIRRDHNDSEWFKDERGLVSAAARYGTYQPSGRAWLRYAFPINTESADPKLNFSVPSALICEYVPLPGISESSNSAMSIAGQQIFQVICRSLNKVLTGYQFADPMIAYIAFSSLVIQAREMIRDYKIANSWSSDNFAYPYGVLNAFGYNEAAAKDLMENMADYRKKFNTLMYQASSIFIPFETNQLKKYIWMADGLWGDKDNPKAQVYGYSSMGYYTFEEEIDPGEPGSWAQFHYFGRDQKIRLNTLFQVKLNKFEDCITRLRNSDSFNYMMSDLRTAFADIEGYVFDSLNEEDSISIDYNDIMLRQFQNLRTIPAVKHTSTVEREAFAEKFNVTQNVMENSILAKPNNVPAVITGPNMSAAYEAIEESYMPTNMLANWSANNPSEDEVIEDLNGLVLWHWDKGNNTFTMDEGDMSCYVPIEFTMVYRLDQDDAWTATNFTSWNYRESDTPSPSSIPSHFWMISMFDWFPIIYDVYVDIIDNVAHYVAVYPLVEDDVLAPITQHQLLL